MANSGGTKTRTFGQKQVLTVETKMERVYAKYQADLRFDHLRATGAKFVPGYGTMRSPRCVFIGEAPGAQEDKVGVPFVGPSGLLLKELLGSIDLKREHVFTTNILKYHPPANRDPKPIETEASWPYLYEEIELLETPVIVPLGRFAFERFFPTLRISDAHGIVMQWHDWTVYPILHPAVALYNPSNRPVMFDDFKTLGELIG